MANPFNVIDDIRRRQWEAGNRSSNARQQALDTLRYAPRPTTPSRQPAAPTQPRLVAPHGFHNPSNVTSGYTGANLMSGAPNPQAAQPSQPAAPTQPPRPSGQERFGLPAAPPAQTPPPAQPMPFEAQVLNTIMPSATVQPQFSDPYEQWKQSGRQGPRPY